MKKFLISAALCATSLVWGIDVQNIDGKLVFEQDNKPISPNVVYTEPNLYFLNSFEEKPVPEAPTFCRLYPNRVDTVFMYKPDSKDIPSLIALIGGCRYQSVLADAHRYFRKENKGFSFDNIYELNSNGFFLLYKCITKDGRVIEEKGLAQSNKEPLPMLTPQKISLQKAEEYDKLLFDPNKAALRNLKNPTTLLKDKESNVFIDSYKVYNDVIVWDVCWRNQKAFWIFDFSDPKTKIKVEAYGEVYNLFSQVVYNGDYDFSQISFFQIGDDKCTVRVNRTGLMELSADIVVHKKDHALLYSLELDPENADFKLITPEQD